MEERGYSYALSYENSEKFCIFFRLPLACPLMDIGTVYGE